MGAAMQLGALGIWLALTATAIADCGVCTSSVRFDEALAACFEKDVDGQLSKIQAGKKIVMINLGACAEKAGTRGDALPGPTKESLDFAFVADEAGLTCLKTRLAEADRPLDPSEVFEMGAACL